MANRLDVIIFGASGFTGKYAVYEAVSVLGDLKWGIAGRNREKLEAVLEEMGSKANRNLRDTPITIASVENEQSLLEMAKRCRVLVNCCGPYRFYGEPVIRACLEAGTHHVDVSGETQFMESMQLKYHAQAQERNVYMISACGFDSIPAEMGIVYAEKNFDGVVNSVEAYVKTYARGGRAAGGGIHYGTWASAIHAIANWKEIRDIRRELFKTNVPRSYPIIKRRRPLSYSDVVKGVCLPFPGPDESVVMRSQRYLYEHKKKRPVQMHAYLTFKSYIVAGILALGALFLGLMMQFSFGRRWLLKYPKLFTFGAVSHEGPSEEAMERTYFSTTIKAMGWPKSSVSGASNEPSGPPTKSLTIKVTGPNPGYGATNVALLCTAKIILKESDKMPGTGGVIPPGAAFAETSLISELEKHEHGLKFEILSNK
ncbi:saccharopine dehydrogenase-like oxidoreductase [Stomoxys calcitrans]|uniref:saccharopine dehydrogenase-like oxidoreductase n=1 Tax=Stomoxys calcitrans TaxID=35570 RepID=UPI0027E36F55|nr:saccharopine dehydrogenase-like oxidoreductase [Stomoxys calcitrans]